MRFSVLSRFSSTMIGIGWNSTSNSNSSDDSENNDPTSKHFINTNGYTGNDVTLKDPFNPTPIHMSQHNPNDTCHTFNTNTHSTATTTAQADYLTTMQPLSPFQMKFTHPSDTASVHSSAFRPLRNQNSCNTITTNGNVVCLNVSPSTEHGYNHQSTPMMRTIDPMLNGNHDGDDDITMGKLDDNIDDAAALVNDGNEGSESVTAGVNGEMSHSFASPSSSFDGAMYDRRQPGKRKRHENNGMRLLDKLKSRASSNRGKRQRNGAKAAGDATTRATRSGASNVSNSTAHDIPTKGVQSSSTAIINAATSTSTTTPTSAAPSGSRRDKNEIKASQACLESPSSPLMPTNLSSSTSSIHASASTSTSASRLRSRSRPSRSGVADSRLQQEETDASMLTAAKVEKAEGVFQVENINGIGDSSENDRDGRRERAEKAYKGWKSSKNSYTGADGTDTYTARDTLPVTPPGSISRSADREIASSFDLMKSDTKRSSRAPDRLVMFNPSSSSYTATSTSPSAKSLSTNNISDQGNRKQSKGNADAAKEYICIDVDAGDEDGLQHDEKTCNFKESHANNKRRTSSNKHRHTPTQAQRKTKKCEGTTRHSRSHPHSQQDQVQAQQQSSASTDHNSEKQAHHKQNHKAKARSAAKKSVKSTSNTQQLQEPRINSRARRVAQPFSFKQQQYNPSSSSSIGVD